MVDMKTVLSVTIVTVLVALDWTSAHPFGRRFPPLPPIHPLPPLPPPVRLTVHPPVSGAQLRLSRSQVIQPLISPGIVHVDPMDSYIVTDQDYYSIGGNVGGPIIAYNDVGPGGFVKYEKPDIDYVAVAPGGPGFY
ncbi:hypothetical protein Btru_002025 [Bulinus truncatus]|nr:hypothetical protein Btru_002025 [Bulinus truncatus]